MKTKCHYCLKEVEVGVAHECYMPNLVDWRKIRIRGGLDLSDPEEEKYFHENGYPRLVDRLPDMDFRPGSFVPLAEEDKPIKDSHQHWKVRQTSGYMVAGDLMDSIRRPMRKPKTNYRRQLRRVR